jgi:hypothetical protein
MAKNTVQGGPSFTDDELNDPDPPVVITRYQLGDDQRLAGDNSTQSSLSESWSSDGEIADPLSPAPTTGNRSGPYQGEEASSTAPLTDGDGRKTEQPPSDEVPPYSEWTQDDLKTELKARGMKVSGRHDELVARLEADDNELAIE